MDSSKFVDDALSQKSAGRRVTLLKRWGIFIALFIAVVVHDMNRSDTVNVRNSVWWWFCLTLFVFFTVVLCRLLLHYIINLLKVSSSIEVTDKQRSLLSIRDTDMGFKPVTPKKASSTPVLDKSVSLSSLFNATLRTPSPMSPSASVTPINMSAGSWGNLSSSGSASVSSLHASLRSPGSSTSSPVTANLSIASSTSASIPANSWTYHRNQSSILDNSYNVVTSPQQHIFSPSQMSDSFLVLRNKNSPITSSPQYGPAITDEAALTGFLTQYKEREKLRQIISQSETNSSMNSSLWAYGASPHSQLMDYGNVLRKNVYQAATKDVGEETNSADSKNDDSKASTLSSSSVSKIWLKRNVTPKELFQFTENVRIWMSSNILVPLVKDIDATNKVLRAVAPEIQIGTVGIDKLKKTSQNISGVKQLADVVPFLDMTIHQQYLVHRLRELSAGGAISAYRWNAGSSSFNGKPWKEEYPTDTAILFHMFVMYMDRQLPPDIQQPEGRMFSSTHVIKTPEKPPKPTNYPLLYVTQVNPPHVKVILPPDEECEVGSGRNNFIHSLLLFIHHVTHQQHSRIANVNLTMSGVNLSWVVSKA